MDEERWLDIEGAYNVRDLGGYETVDGRQTRSRVFLRADNLYRLSESGQKKLLDYRLKTVVDLRGTPETIETPNVFPQSTDVEYLHRNMIGDSDLSTSVGPPPGGGETPEWISSTYQILLDFRQDAICDILKTLGGTDGRTTLFHCAVGTDRTGVVAALLLGLVGVPHDTIAEDYAFSAEALRIRYLAEGIPEDLAEITPADLIQQRALEWLVPPEAMLITLQHLDDKYGGIESYARHIGLTDTEIENIRSALLE
jgi:protein-tyrosine phosphatase